MNWLDILLAILLVSSMASAFSTGFVRESIGLAAALIGLLCGAWFYRIAAEPLRPHVRSQQAANLCGFLLIFIAALVLGWLLSKTVGMLVKAVGLSWLDRLLGAAFGGVRGILVCVAVITAIV